MNLLSGLGAGLDDVTGLGISVGVKVSLPPEVKAAVRELPNTTEALKRIGAAADTWNITGQTVAVMAAFGFIIGVLLLREGKKK